MLILCIINGDLHQFISHCLIPLDPWVEKYFFTTPGDRIPTNMMGKGKKVSNIFGQIIRSSFKPLTIIKYVKTRFRGEKIWGNIFFH